ncbi:MAG: RagB/SusD family nutrient uptake outer membrane protein [Prevotellaceae bacterium]|jgi:hypothetical protein|nr:RagB/SusD family nutrient uptake outer membrane protein [Prevotellaceae bacterium]
MKKITIFGLIALGAVTSCDSYLETASPSSNSVDATFASSTDANNALMGVYALLCEDAMYSSRMSLFWQTNTDIEITSSGSGDYKNSDRRGLSNYCSRPTFDISDVTNPWNTMYSGIERLNLCIANIPGSPATAGEHHDKMMELYGEALTLRALFYMELCRQYGDVPFRTEPASPTTFYVERTGRDAIYERLLADLDEAAAVLPWANEAEGGVERCTKGFALGLKARIAMYRAGYSLRSDGQTRQGSDPERYYQIAKEACQQLIDEGPHKLAEDFADYYITQCRNQIHPSIESLFEVAFGIGKSGEVGYSIGTRFDVATKYSTNSTQGYVNTTPIFLYSFDEKDKRRDVTVNIYTYANAAASDVATGPEGIRQKIPNSPNAFRIGKWSIKHLTGASLEGSLGTAAGTKYTNGINWPVMRLADVYLLLAEAEYMLNGVTGTAREALEAVRQRAFDPADHSEKVSQYVASLNESSFFDAIVNERAWELAGEAVRKYDLVRWNLLPTKLREFKEENYSFVQTGMLPAKYPNSKYNPIPSTLYYKFDETGDYPEIDMSAINLYQTLSAPPDASYYTFTSWITLKSDNGSETKDSDLESYRKWIEEYVNVGYDYDVNNHLFALPSSVVATSGGLWDNDPYWANVKSY